MMRDARRRFLRWAFYRVGNAAGTASGVFVGLSDWAYDKALEHRTPIDPSVFPMHSVWMAQGHWGISADYDGPMEPPRRVLP